MAKYDSQIVELKNLLPTAKNTLIALPAGADIDKLACGLALMLILNGQGKEITVVSDDTITVGQSYLFGVDHIQKTFPTTEGGNLTLSLEGVAASDKTVPALEKLDWYAENNNLNLVFHVIPGQTFQPVKIVPKYSGGGYDLIFVIGALNLNSLGNVYQQNQQAFSGTHLVNIDLQSANTGFGQTNVLDTNSSSVSEIMVNLISDLNLSLDADTASNLLAGIFDATNILSNNKASADTFLAIANLLRAGGKKPEVAKPQTTTQDLSSLIPKQEVSFTQPILSSQPQPQLPNISDFITPPPSNPVQPTSTVTATSVNQPADNQQPASPAQRDEPSPEERPVEEGTITETPEPDWLTPKIFKGSSLG